MNDQLIDLLIRSLDEELTSGEQQQLDLGLLESEELRGYKTELLQMRELLGNGKSSFTKGFDTRVMDSIRKQDFESGLYNVQKWIALPAAAAIAVLLALNYYSDGSLTMDSLLGIKSVSNNIVTLTVVGY